MTTRAPVSLSRPTIEFQQLQAASDRTQAETANYLKSRLNRDISNYHVSRWAGGQVKVPVDVMDAMRELAAQPADAPPAAAQYDETSEVVPLFGYANAAGSTLRISEDQRVGVVPAHPGQRGARSAFAFIVFGDSLSPRLSHGEVGYAVRNRTPVKGQPFIIELNNGDALVKLFDGADDSTIFAKQLSPKKDLSWALRDVAAIHAVVGISFGHP
jgi:hypothetical protein